MRTLLVALGLVGCGASEDCDARTLARRLAADDDAIDCGSATPYAGRYDLDARELSVPCMADALTAGRPFYGVWLVDCQLEVCFFEGRAYDGTTMWLVEQAILDDAPSTSGIELVLCEPALRERVISTPGGEVLRREIECARVLSTEDVDVGDCPT